MDIEKKLISELPYQETKMYLIQACGQRAKPGVDPKGDFEVLQPEFVDLKEDGTLIVNFPLFDWQCNGLGNLQGGMQSYIMDCAFGMLGFVSISGQPIASVDMTTHFLKSANSNDDKKVTVFARVTSMGRKLLHAECSMYNDKGELISSASTNMYRI